MRITWGSDRMGDANRRIDQLAQRTDADFRRLRDELRSQRDDIHALRQEWIRSGSRRCLR